MYSGRDLTIRSGDGQGSEVVMHLMEQANLLDKGHHLRTADF